MLSRIENWAVAAIGAFLGTAIVAFFEWVGASLGAGTISPFTRTGALKFLLLWAVCTILNRVFVIWLPDKIRSKRERRG